MSASQLSRAIAGKKVFTLDQLDALCAVIGIDMVELVSAADIATRGRPLPSRGKLIIGDFGVSAQNHDENRAAAKEKSRDRGTIDGQG